MKWVIHIIASVWLTGVLLVNFIGYALVSTAPGKTTMDLVYDGIEFIFFFLLYASPSLIWFGYGLFKGESFQSATQTRWGSMALIIALFVAGVFLALRFF